MTVTPTPPNEPQGTNQPSQMGRVIKMTPFNIVLGIGVVAGLVMSAIAIIYIINRPPEPGNLSDEQSRMYDLGAQWAQGYVQALQSNNPDQNVLNSLYGACVVYSNNRIVIQYGQQLTPSWLAGCLDYVRGRQETSAPTTTTN